MSEACEPFEIQISALLDGELDRDERLEALDHLVRCAGCRTFYRAARAVDGLALAHSPAVPAAPAALWSAIERGAAPRRRRGATWLLRAAALVALGLGLGLLLARQQPPPEAPLTAAATEATRPGRTMTEDRFVEITRQLLDSDRRYQRAMLQVMDEVLTHVPTTEGGGELEELEDGGTERDLGRA